MPNSHLDRAIAKIDDADARIRKLEERVRLREGDAELITAAARDTLDAVNGLAAVVQRHERKLSRR